MDKTKLVNDTAELFRVSGHKVDISIEMNHREIDIRAEETQGLVRKVILIECAEYARPVGIDKLQTDVRKLHSAKEVLGDNAIIMHVSRHGYSKNASGYAAENGIPATRFEDLRSQLINFDSYIEAIDQDPLRSSIMTEYQPNPIHYEGSSSESPSVRFLEDWLGTDSRWLTLLGDYGVGKSWTLKRFLYALIEKYRADPMSTPLPLFIPLQQFTKAFDFQNLIIRTMQLIGLTGVHYGAFEYLMSQGRIIFLLDSFDEMAQHLSRNTIRENLKELLVGISSDSRAIMTSRPTYFEGRSERLLLVERDGSIEWHPLDQQQLARQTAMSRVIGESMHTSRFARVSDLTITQRKALFEVVLGRNSPAYQRLMGLFDRFQNLESISQRAVIARLLTMVATALSDSSEILTEEGSPVIPEDLKDLNEAKIFEIVVYNLLYRDQNLGTLSNSQRLHFLRSFAVQLQQRDNDLFASPAVLRSFVARLFQSELARSDTPEQLLESYYRICRRHSGLTTEGQFRDTSGHLDIPVSEEDDESRVGFSHNSLREYLAADAIVAFLRKGTRFERLNSTVVTDSIGDFVFQAFETDEGLAQVLERHLAENQDSKMAEILFKIVQAFLRRDARHVSILGTPPRVSGTDLSNVDLSGLRLQAGTFLDGIAQDTDLRKSDLREAVFRRMTLENVMLDGALLTDADFREAEIVSIFVFDEFDTRTSAVLKGRKARQWLHSRGALVSPTSDLNPLLGQPWYEAAREVTDTLVKRIGGTHQDVSLSKGTKEGHRVFAGEFVEFLVSRKVLDRVTRSSKGPGYVVKLRKEYRESIVAFSKEGKIDGTLKPFFDKHGIERK